jgi:predicted RecB family nuclease
MKRNGKTLELAATDLVCYLNCGHLSNLDRAVADGVLAKPHVWRDPLLEVLWERGAVHEQNYVEHLKRLGLDVVRIDGIDVTSEALEQTRSAMRGGANVIIQGALSYEGWCGRIDALRRVEAPSDLGGWSYEVVDTKLARETKAGTILQLCLYSWLLEQAQGLSPEHMYVVSPWSDFEPNKYHFTDYAAYFRKIKRGLREALAAEETKETYPDPKPHCDICRWRNACDQRRRDDDHLCLVAGISKIQISELKRHDIATAQALAATPAPFAWKPERGSARSYHRIREQARVQVEARETGKPKFELLPMERGFGLAILPEPSGGDIFLDIEGDPFVGEHGLEYLFGYQFQTDAGSSYLGDLALSRADEKRAFEAFVDFVMVRWRRFPQLHIFHYAPYEPAALKRLMGRYATRQEEIDQMLRARLFVDLYAVVRHSIRASVESYSIKKLECFYGFVRDAALPVANVALARIQANLELDDIPSISEEMQAVVLAYNEDDCRSAAALRDWLEVLRSQAIANGADVPRPMLGEGAPTERITDWIVKINGLIERLTADVPADRQERDEEQQARWILANILDFHRREDKAVWWEHFRLAALSAEELLDERAGLSGLTFIENVGETARGIPIHRYKFPPQETEIRGGEELRNLGGEELGAVESISFESLTVDIRKRGDSAAIHPQAVYAHKIVRAQVMADALVRLGEHVVANGLSGGGPQHAACDLLLKLGPRLGGEPIRKEGETTLQAAVRLAGHLGGGVFPIQGPPGAGKTFTAARMICELVRQGKTVGVTANSHKVIRNLIDETIRAAEVIGLDLHCCQKVAELEALLPRLRFVKTNEDLLQSLGGPVAVGGGTAWLWAHPDAFEAVDVLFVDEAAQMSLANVLAVAQSAHTVVLVGDPQQLDQPTQGSHPDGVDLSALNHILGGQQTIPPDKGLFLEETWRLHPDICAFNSELFYAGKLRSKAGLDRLTINSSGPISGSGLRYLPVDHSGNQNCSPEEVEAIGNLVQAVLSGATTWVDRDGRERPVALDDILIITPYNAQVFEIRRRIPGARVGTVDKFQGQEAAIAIYSIATSSHADAPRGMEFLYSQNRLNVAISRAKCVSILVGSPRIFEAECRTPRQMQLANAFCRFLEMAVHLDQKICEGHAAGVEAAAA